MKQHGTLLLLGLILSACGTAPSNITGNGKVSIGVNVNNGNSDIIVTRSYTAAVLNADGTVKTPAKEAFSTGTGTPVSFTFMTAPGSDAVYIRGYKILKHALNGTVLSTSTNNSLNLYLTSGYSCPEITALYSCNPYLTDGTINKSVVTSNGMPGTISINFYSELAAAVISTKADAYNTFQLQFFGESSNGQEVLTTPVDFGNKGMLVGDKL